MAQTKSDVQIQLTPIDREVATVDIEGVSPLIPHKWSEKALRMMREAQSGTKARAKREPKVPEEEAEAALYRLPDGRLGMPATGFKKAIYDAVRLFDGLTLVQAKTAFFVLGEGADQLVPAEAEMELHEDTPRNANGVADLRYRYYLWPWTATLQVEYLPRIIDRESVVILVDAAGNGGVGDWRPSAPKSATGTFGRFRVKTG